MSDQLPDLGSMVWYLGIRSSRRLFMLTLEADQYATVQLSRGSISTSTGSSTSRINEWSTRRDDRGWKYRFLWYSFLLRKSIIIKRVSGACDPLTLVLTSDLAFLHGRPVSMSLEPAFLDY